MLDSLRTKCKEIKRRLEQESSTDASFITSINTDLQGIISSTQHTLSNTPSGYAFIARSEELENELQQLNSVKDSINKGKTSEAINILNNLAEGKADPSSYFTGMDDLFTFQDPDDY